MRPALLLLIPALLTGCQTAQQRCESAAVQDLRVVNDLIAETEATLARGYGLQTVQSTRPVATFCWGGGYGYYDDWDAGYGLCWGNTVTTEERPVAVDLDEQRRALRSLVAKKNELEVQARAELDACAQLAPG